MIRIVRAVSFLSVNAKQPEHPALQAGPSRCESGHGHQRMAESREPRAGQLRSRPSALDLFPPPKCKKAARRSAKTEVRGANPRGSAIPNAGFGMQKVEHRLAAVPTEGGRLIPHSAFRIPDGGHDVTAALRHVTASVPVQIRLVTPISMGRS